MAFVPSGEANRRRMRPVSKSAARLAAGETADESASATNARDMPRGIAQRRMPSFSISAL